MSTLSTAVVDEILALFKNGDRVFDVFSSWKGTFVQICDRDPHMALVKWDEHGKTISRPLDLLTLLAKN